QRTGHRREEEFAVEKTAPQRTQAQSKSAALAAYSGRAHRGEEELTAEDAEDAEEETLARPSFPDDDARKSSKVFVKTRNDPRALGSTGVLAGIRFKREQELRKNRRRGRKQ